MLEQHVRLCLSEAYSELADVSSDFCFLTSVIWDLKPGQIDVRDSDSPSGFPAIHPG